MDWTDFFTGIASAGSSIASAVIGPRVPTVIPGTAGTVYVPPAAGGSIVQSGLLGSGGNSTLILVLIAVVLVFALRS